MNRVFLSRLLSSLAFVVVSSGVAAAESGAEVLAKVDGVEHAAKDSLAEIRMVLIDKDGDQKVREATVKQKGDSKRIFKFSSPADVKGVGVLVLEDDVMYLYMPAFHKVRRIGTSSKNDTFMGTDFTFDDMGSLRYTADYDVSAMKDDGGKHVLTLKPKKDRDKPYDRLVMWVQKDNYMFTKVEYYDKAGKLQKVLTRSEMRKQGDYWFAFKMEMSDVRKRHRTTMEVSSAKFDNGFSDRKFSERYLKRE